MEEGIMRRCTSRFHVRKTGAEYCGKAAAGRNASLKTGGIHYDLRPSVGDAGGYQSRRNKESAHISTFICWFSLFSKCNCHSSKPESICRWTARRNAGFARKDSTFQEPRTRVGR